MGEGLAASLVTNTYGTGEGQNTKHYYAGAKATHKQKSGKIKKKKSKEH